ncbi:MAG: Mur ligase family protein, partial [Microbacteriaceae bacterium]
MPARIPPVLRPEHPPVRSLAGLVSEFGLEYSGSVDGVELTGITVSTDDLHPGDLYVGIPGAHNHGARFAGQAAAGGAVAIMTDRTGRELASDSGLPVVVVDSPRSALGEVSAWIYRTKEHPPLLFGVTGTNGKTSTCYLLEGVLKQLGLVTGLSSTSERHIGELAVVSRLTTPEASEMHALLARMRESGVRAVAVEVSAQALSRNRVDGLFFDVAAFTNLSHDH